MVYTILEVLMKWDKEGALDKVKKLLALSGSDNEHEAAQAAAMAQKFIVEYNLSIETLSDISASDTNIIEEEVDASSRMAAWRTQLMSGVSRAFECRPVVYTSYRHTRLVIVGTKADTTLARHTIEYLCGKLLRQGQLWELERKKH